MDSLRPTPWAVSAGTGEHEPIFMNPIGLVLERLTTPALARERNGHTHTAHWFPEISFRIPPGESDQLKEILVFQEKAKKLSFPH